MKAKLTKLQFWLIYGAVIVGGIIIDQVTKIVCAKVLSDKTINIIGEWLQLSWTINHGAAFGGFQGANIMFFFVTLIGVPLFGWLLWRSYTRSVWGQVGFSLVISGALGNAIDRAFLGDGFFNGGVRDMISVEGFAIFNVADSFLTVGVILAIFALLWADRDSLIKDMIKDAQAKKANNSSAQENGGEQSKDNKDNNSEDK